MSGPCPRVDNTVLASSQKAVLAEDQSRQSLVGDLLADQRLENGTLVEPRTRRRPDQLDRIEGGDARAQSFVAREKGTVGRRIPRRTQVIARVRPTRSRIGRRRRRFCKSGG